MNMYSLLTFLMYFNGVLVLLALLGFFERRENGEYQFRINRFFVIVALLLLMNLLAVPVFIHTVRSGIAQGFQDGENSVLANRAVGDFILNNTSLFLPNKVNEAAKQCWHSALSNYIEDQWNQSFRDRLPRYDYYKLAGKVDKQEDYYEAVRAQLNPQHLYYKDNKVVGAFMNSVWVTAAGLYKNERQLFQQPDGKGNIPPFDQSLMTNYQHYLANCSAMKPLPWVNPGESISNAPPQFCVGDCP